MSLMTACITSMPGRSAAEPGILPPRRILLRSQQLRPSIMVAFSLGPGWRAFGPAVVRVRTAKSAVAGDHLLHAHFVGWQSAIVMKEIARISARAPRHLSGLADAKVEQHCHRYGHHDEHLIAWVASSRIAALLASPVAGVKPIGPPRPARRHTNKRPCARRGAGSENAPAAVSAASRTLSERPSREAD